MWFFSSILIVTLLRVESQVESRDAEDSGETELGRDLNVTRNTQVTDGAADDNDDSVERIGASVTQIFKYPYAAALLRNDTYQCSAVILNTYWLLTLTKCFDTDTITSYVTHRKLGNYTVRTGSSYNHKGGYTSQVKMLINNFDLKVSAVKLTMPLAFSSKVNSVSIPSPEEDVTLGFLATMLAWTPSGHMRIVNAPVISSTLCESSTLPTEKIICVGGVQDPDRHFCRKDNGGAVIQNNTLIGLSSFIHTCALYTKTHAFPKISTFSRWLDTVIWDENNRPTTTSPPPTTQVSQTIQNTTDTMESSFFIDPRNFMVTLPFDPINVPLEPAEDNSVIPRMSLYESYLQNMARAKTSTTMDPNVLEERKREWLQKFGKSLLMMPPQLLKKYEQLDYN